MRAEEVPDPRIDALESEVARLRGSERRYHILAEHMAEVKAIADGANKNTLQDVVNHCLDELGKQVVKEGGGR